MYDKLLSSIYSEKKPTNLDEISEIVKKIVSDIEQAIKSKKIKAKPFLGGSFAKNTMIKRERQDIDLFLRFSQDHAPSKLSNLTESIVKQLKIPYQRLHGSRDYFTLKHKKFDIEIIPSYNIKKVSEAKNVTDLSYFHVNYVGRKVTKEIEKEIILTKSFCYAQNVYGAESYINGFSGYALELLLIHYKKFTTLLKKLSAATKQTIIDIEKQYKSKNEVLIHLNPSRLHSPIVLIDPTFKERNACAALSQETFSRFQKAAIQFLKKPSKSFFEKEELDEEILQELAKSKKAEYIQLKYSTNRQGGDIAGTKLKKFHSFFLKELAEYFEIMEEHFQYNGKKDSISHLIIKTKGDNLIRGPPITNVHALQSFKKKHRKAIIKGNHAFYKRKGFKNFSKFQTQWKKSNKRRLKEMGISL